MLSLWRHTIHTTRLIRASRVHYTTNITRKAPGDISPHRRTLLEIWGSGHRACSTVDPTQLMPWDYIDLSGTLRCILTCSLRYPESDTQDENSNTTHSERIPSIRVAYNNGKSIFPPHTTGFLYYHLEPSAPVLSGEVRLRKSHSSDPTVFSTGEDLLQPDGTIWRIPGLRILAGMTYVGLKEILKESSFAHDMWTKYDNHQVLAGIRREDPIVWKFGQSFPVNIGSQTPRVVTVSNKEIGLAALGKVWQDTRSQSCSTAHPYKGHVDVCFEKSTFPEHQGQRRVIIRVLRLHDDVECVVPEYDGYVKRPEVGLVYDKFKKGLPRRVWSLDIDEPEMSQPLREALTVLWDSE